MVGIKLVSGFALPAEGALSLARIKDHLRVIGPDEDALITGYALAAIGYCQDVTGRAVVASTWRQTVDRFPPSGQPIRLLRSPVSAVTAVTYRDTAGESQTVDVETLLLDADAEPARLSPGDASWWPTDASVRPGAVSVTFTAGGGEALEYVSQAVYLLVGQWYEVREAVSVGGNVSKVPFAVDALLGLAKLPWIDFEV